MAQSTFIGYPVPKEASASGDVTSVETNPVLRGWPLVIATNILTRAKPITGFLFANAGFKTLVDVPGIDAVAPRYDPCVTPTGSFKEAIVPFDAQLITPRSTDANNGYYTIADYHALYKAGSLTPLQVVDSLLPRISRQQSSPGLYEDAWVDSHGSHRLALEAAKASTERYKQGRPLGVLDGVPIGVKDDTDVEGWSNHWGMRTDTDNAAYKPQTESCWPIKKLQEAGAIVVGKNRMHEVGCETSGCNPSQGTPTNHHNNSYFPGGSSSGGASSVSAGIVPLAVGTDAGGSIRIPSSNNGVYGLNPSHQRTMAMSWSTCRTGPIAANVADLTIAYRLMAQPNPDCPIQGRFTPSQPLEKGAKRTIGICEAMWKPADPRVAETCRRAIDWIAGSKGYEVVDITIPLISEGRLAMGLMCLADITRMARDHALDRSNWLASLNHPNQINLAAAQHSSVDDFVAANAVRSVVMSHLSHLFAKHQNLLIVTPTVPITGWPKYPGDDTHGVSDSNLSIKNMMYVYLANIAGTPSVSVPAGYLETEHGEGKMPVGLMALAEWGQEEQLLSWAGESEEYLNNIYEGGKKRPKTWFDVVAEARAQ